MRQASPRHTRVPRSGRGFTLIELMITVAIVAILAAIAYPAYRDQVTSARRTDAKATLLEMAGHLERYYFENAAYTNDLTDIGYASAANVASPEGHYEISVAAPTAACPIATCFRLEADGVGAQAADGTLSLTSAGQRNPSEKW